MSSTRDWTLPLLSAALFFLAFLTPTLPANLVFLVPVLVWLERAPDAAPRRRFGVLLRFTVVAYAVSLYWVWAMLWISWLAALMWLGLLILFAVPNAAALAVAGWMRRSVPGAAWGWILPVTWLPVEWLRSFGDLRMTADHVAYSVARYPFLCQIAEVVGPFGVGAAVLAVNGLIADIALSRGRRRAAAGIALAGLVAAVLGYDAWAWGAHAPDDGPGLRVGIVQPNVPIEDKGEESTAVGQLRTLNRLTFEAVDRGAELVVWPETARPEPMYHWPDRPETYRMPELSILAEALDVSMLVGSEYVRVRDLDSWDLYNAAFAVERDGTLAREWTAKRYLVPFVEDVPFQTLTGALLRDRGGDWKWLSGGFEPGPAWTMLPFGFGDVGVLVCFEQLFPGPSRAFAGAGAVLQVVVTNDAWWGRTRFQQYQRDALRLRAIETRTWFVRAANTGISGVVDSRGVYRTESGLFEERLLVENVILREGPPTPYVRIGDLVAWLALAAGLVAVGVGRWRDAARPPVVYGDPGGAGSVDRGPVLGSPGGPDPTG